MQAPVDGIDGVDGIHGSDGVDGIDGIDGARPGHICKPRRGKPASARAVEGVHVDAAHRQEATLGLLLLLADSEELVHRVEDLRQRGLQEPSTCLPQGLLETILQPVEDLDDQRSGNECGYP